MSAPGQAASAKIQSPWLARQPILTQKEKVLGYELLFREGAEDKQFSSDAESATNSIIDTLDVVGLDLVCDGTLAFINCTRRMLLKESFLLLPADRVVIEIQHDVPADEAVMVACHELHQKKYKLALDNFSLDDPREGLSRYADFIKLDIRRFTPEQIADVAASHANEQCQLIAQKVETREQFVRATKSGFTLFQGYFFQQPQRMRARHIPADQAGHVRLLKAITAPEVDLEAIEGLIKHDPSLCYRLLRYLNSPLLGVASPVQSVRHAMNLLGERELIRWIRMATMLVMGQEKCSDLVISSLVRARFCELVATKVEHGGCDLFLIGMFSLMDAILEVPMGVVVEGLAFDAATKTELLAVKAGRKTRLSPVYDLMVARERADWEDVTANA